MQNPKRAGNWICLRDFSGTVEGKNDYYKQHFKACCKDDNKIIYAKCVNMEGGYIGAFVKILRQEALFRILPGTCSLHTSASQHNSNRTSIACIPRHKYTRVYPVLLVRPGGSTIHIRYKEPRRILWMPVDINTLPEAERKARLRRKNAGRAKFKQEDDFEDDFQLDDYRKFWKSK